MTSIGTGYDLSASQFSPDGFVFQIEYALKAVENSATAIALRGKDGVVFAVEKLVTSKLYEKGSNQRIFTIDRHIGCAVAGLRADAAQIIETARKESDSYRNEYGLPVPSAYLKDRVALYVHAHTLYSAIRPFGAAIMMASYNDDEGGKLYCVEPSGTCHGYCACAIGKAKETAKTEIEKLNLSEMTCDELAKEAAKIIYIVHDDAKDRDFKLELSWVCKQTAGMHQLVPENIFHEAEAYARRVTEDNDYNEDD